MELLVTIDTEPDCDIHWNRSSPLTFTSVTEGIPELMRPIWDKYRVNPIYFISPEVLYDDASCEVLKREIDRGAIIGSHLHSEYIEPNICPDMDGKGSGEFPCFAHSKETEYEKLKNLTQLIEEKLSYTPVWYRAARYGADLDTIKSLASLGYKYDSSITPGIDWSPIGGPDHSKSPLQPYWISKTDFYAGTDEKEGTGIREYPITIHGKRFGPAGKLLPDKWLFYRWLRPSHMTVLEQKNLIREYIREFGDPSFIHMFHSMEIMINKTPFVRNRFMQKRFLKNIEKVLEFYRKVENG
jgi:hypothetical protein